jgi:hypothetical protein
MGDDNKMKTYSPVMDEYFRIALATGLIKEATVAPHHFPGGPLEQHTKTVNPLPLAPGDVPKEDMYTRSDRSRATGYETTLNDRESRKPLDDRPGISKSNKNDTMAQIVVWFLSKEMLGVNLPTTFIDGVWGNNSREALNKLITVGKLDLAVGEKLEPSTVQKFYNDNRAKINSALASAGAEKTLAKLNIPAGKVLAADDPVAFVAPSSVVGQENVGKFTKEQMSAFMGIYNDPKFKGKDFPFIMEEATNKFPSLFPKSKYKTMDFTAANDGAMNEKMKENMWQGATLSEASMNKTSNYVVNELISLANDLDKMGEVKAAIAVDNQLSLYKTAMDKLYDITGETGEQFLNSAHPEGSVTLAPAQNEGGVVETAVDQQKKNIAIVSKDPTGKYASTIKSLIATANRLESEGNIVDAEKVDRAINELLKKSPFQHKKLVTATSFYSIKKNADESDDIFLKAWYEKSSGFFHQYNVVQNAIDKLLRSFDSNPPYEQAKVNKLWNAMSKYNGFLLRFDFKGMMDKKLYFPLKMIFEFKKALGELVGVVNSYKEDELSNILGPNDSGYFSNIIEFNKKTQQSLEGFYKSYESKISEFYKKTSEQQEMYLTGNIAAKTPEGNNTSNEVNKKETSGESGNAPKVTGKFTGEAYIDAVKNTLGTLRSIMKIIVANKEKIATLMGLDKLSIGSKLDEVSVEIGKWETIYAKGTGISRKEAEDAIAEHKKIYPLFEKLSKKFAKAASNNFAISKRAADFLTDLDSKLGLATPAKPGAGRGGAGKGGRVIFSGPEASKLQSLIVRAGEDKYGSLLGKVDERIGPKTIAAYNLLRGDLGSMGKDVNKLPAGHQLIDEQTVRRTFDVLSDMLSKLNEADIKKLKTPSEPGTTPGAPGTTPGQPGGAAGTADESGWGPSRYGTKSPELQTVYKEMERLDSILPFIQDSEAFPSFFNSKIQGENNSSKQLIMGRYLIATEDSVNKMNQVLRFDPLGKNIASSDNETFKRYIYILSQFPEAMDKRCSENFKGISMEELRVRLNKYVAKQRAAQEQQAPEQPAAQEPGPANEPWDKLNKDPQAEAVAQLQDIMYKINPNANRVTTVDDVNKYITSTGQSKSAIKNFLVGIYKKLDAGNQEIYSNKISTLIRLMADGKW